MCSEAIGNVLPLTLIIIGKLTENIEMFASVHVMYDGHGRVDF